MSDRKSANIAPPVQIKNCANCKPTLPPESADDNAIQPSERRPVVTEDDTVVSDADSILAGTVVSDADSILARRAAALDAALDSTWPKVDFLVDLGFSRPGATEAVLCGDGTIGGAVAWLAGRGRGNLEEETGEGGDVEEGLVKWDSAVWSTAATLQTANLSSPNLSSASTQSAGECSHPTMPPRKPENELVRTTRVSSLPADFSPVSMQVEKHGAGGAYCPEQQPEVLGDEACSAAVAGTTSRTVQENERGVGMSEPGVLTRTPPPFATGIGESFLRRSGAQRSLGRESSVRDSSLVDGNSSILMTPAANDLPIPKTEEGERHDGESEPVNVATPGPPSVCEKRWVKIGIAMLAVGLVGVGLALGLTLGKEGIEVQGYVQDSSTTPLPGSGNGTELGNVSVSPSPTPWPTDLSSSPPSVVPTPRSTTDPTPILTSPSTPTPSSHSTLLPTLRPTPQTTLLSTLPPTAKATNIEDAFKETICFRLQSTCDDLLTQGTPQFDAFSWLASDQRFGEYSEYRKIQRYVLGVVAYSLHGWGSGGAPNGSVAPEDECNWVWGWWPKNKIKCRFDEVIEIGFDDSLVGQKLPRDVALLSDSVEKLHFGYANFSGTIPSEWGMLSNLKRIELTSNSLSGTIPSAIGSLNNLKVLDLTDNDLTGRLPSELGLLTKLERIFLSFNELSGTIPSAVGALKNLKLLDLTKNKLSGPVPGELGLLIQLEELYLHGNGLIGTMPNELCHLRDKDGKLGALSADCDKVQCDCCNYCCFDDTNGTCR